MSYLGNAKSVQALTVYEVWRDRFLRDRLRPAVGIAIFFAFTITVYFLGKHSPIPRSLKLFICTRALLYNWVC
jgi:hypothetical protein